MKRAVVTAVAAILTALIATLFLLRFEPSRLLLTETARPAIAAIIVVLGAFACGTFALRLVRSNDDSIASAILIGIATLGTMSAAAALISTAIVPIITIVAAFGGDWAAIVFAFTPALMIIAGWAWSEWAVLGLLLLAYERFSIDDTNGGACALGCAIAVKYTALPWLLAAAIIRRKHVLRTAII